MINRVCLYGGPGVGKSTMAARIFARLKELHLPYELVDEAIKPLAWQKIQPQGFDSLWLLGQQIHMEDIILRSGGRVVTGGPSIQQVVYMRMRNEEFSSDLFRVAQMFEHEHPAINILLTRNVPYSADGRYQNDEEEARKIDELTRHLLKHSYVGYREFVPQQLEEIMKYINQLGGMK